MRGASSPAGGGGRSFPDSLSPRPGWSGQLPHLALKVLGPKERKMLGVRETEEGRRREPRQTCGSLC